MMWDWAKAYRELTERAEAYKDDETGVVGAENVLPLLGVYTPEQRTLMLAGTVAAWLNGASEEDFFRFEQERVRGEG